METFKTKSELRESVKNAMTFKAYFTCGLQFFHYKRDTDSRIDGLDDIGYQRYHEYNFMFKEYDFEKFVNAVWGKIKRGGKFSELEIRY